MIAAAIAALYTLGFQLLGITGSLLVSGVVGTLVHYTLAGPVVAGLPSVAIVPSAVKAPTLIRRSSGRSKNVSRAPVLCAVPSRTTREK